MEKDGVLVCVLIFLLTILLYTLRRSKREPHNRAKLPPGSLEWPYIGETLQLYSQDPNVFFSNKQKRTRILGCPCIMLASPEAARFVLVTQAHLFKPTYPKSKEDLIGPSALFFHQGDYHIRLRKLVKSSLSPESIRNLVADIESLAVSALASWTEGHVTNTFNEMKKFSFEVGVLAIFGHLDAQHREELKRNYTILDRGYNSFRMNILGTPYRKALVAEQRKICESNDGGNRPLTWTQTRNMPITYKVVLESLRMASIISFTFREAVADVEYKGYLIPKGWKVMPLFRNIHHNPEFFTDPHKFDPSRFEVAPTPNKFLPFGSGVHACPGNELAKLEILIMTHHLVNKYRWEVEGYQSGIQYGPFPVPLHGLPATFWKEPIT